MVKTVFDVFSYLSLLGQIGILLVILPYIIKPLFKNIVYKKVVNFISKRAYVLAFFLSLTATLSSLFISEIGRLQPCLLCWYQRIFMYPQPILLLIALFKKEFVLKTYLITLNITGSIIALYHYLLQILPKSQIITCNKPLTGISISCTENYNFYFGYMSFPLMAFTVFIMLIIFINSYDAENIDRTK
jgi:disulfide bond formation protein DsbB